VYAFYIFVGAIAVHDFSVSFVFVDVGFDSLVELEG